MTRILHIAEDSTYLNFAIENFEIVNPGGNHFLVNGNIHQHANLDVSTQSGCLTRARFGSEQYGEQLVDAGDRYDLVIFHNVGGNYKLELARRFKGRVPIHGIFWGFELYDSPLLEKFLYLRKTRKAFIVDTQAGWFASRWRDLKNWIRATRNGRLSLNTYAATIEALSSYSTILESESRFLKDYYGVQRAAFPFNYSGGHGLANLDTRRNGKSIMVGNSATPSNNHLDLLALLGSAAKNLDRLVLPLSYGDAGYGEAVGTMYRRTFGDRVTLLTDYVDVKQYARLVGECGFVLMGHIRQQAMGNIYLALFQGAKVFLSEKSFAFKELTNLGYIVYRLQDLESETESLELETNIAHNKQLVLQHRGEEAITWNIRRIVEHYRPR